MAIFNFFNASRPQGTADVFVEHSAGHLVDNLNNIFYEMNIGFIIENDNISNSEWIGTLDINQTNSPENIVVLQSATVEVWARTKLRLNAESPLLGISNIREYNTECVELTFSEFIAGRNTLTNLYLNDLGLTITDWHSYISELILQLSLPLNSATRKKAVSTLNGLLRETKLSDKVPRFWTTDAQKLEWVQNNLPQELFKLTLSEMVIPLVKKTYPLPEVQYEKWLSGGNKIVVPTCDDYKGVCCLYDEEEKEIRPGLVKTVKVYKDCIPNTDKATCLNQTKRYSRSSDNATRGMYDGADFFNDNEKEYGCELCKSPTSVVYCSDMVPFIYKNLRIDTLKTILNNDNTAPKTNIQYFDNPTDAQAEYNKRVKSGTCNIVEEPLASSEPPSILLDTCYDDSFSINIMPASGCTNDYVTYNIYIDNNLVEPDSISWNPGPANSSQSLATANFIGSYQGSTISVRSSNCVLNETDNSITCGKFSVNSNSITIDCPTTTTTTTTTPIPTPTPTPTPIIFSMPIPE